MSNVRGTGAIRAALLVAAAALAIVLLGNAPALERRMLHAPGTAAYAPLPLSDGNLVGALQNVGLKARIGRVQWDYGILSVDLEAPSAGYGYEDGDADVRSLAAFAFEGTVNVRELLVRIYPEEAASRLLLSAYARRDAGAADPAIVLTPDGSRFFGVPAAVRPSR